MIEGLVSSKTSDAYVDELEEDAASFKDVLLECAVCGMGTGSYEFEVEGGVIGVCGVLHSSYPGIAFGMPVGGGNLYWLAVCFSKEYDGFYEC